MSSRLGAQETAAGGEVNAPPSDVQPSCEGSHWLPSQVFWYIARSSPSPKMSSRLGAQETAAGGEVNAPPSDVQPSCEGSHWLPSQVFWYIARSSPSAKMSSRLGAQETPAGGEVNAPPSHVQDPAREGSMNSQYAHSTTLPSFFPPPKTAWPPSN